MNETYAQRMRVWFATDETVKYVGHLDMHRTWERAIRRARLPLAYTQGFNPQPRLQFAAALPVGFTGQGEVADIFLNEELPPSEFVERLGAALPPGIRPFSAQSVARELPSLQSQVNGARYHVEVETGDDDASLSEGALSEGALSESAFTERLVEFLGRTEAWRERRKGKDISRYDLRPLIQDLHYTGPVPHGHSFEVAMRAEPGATGRPDELLAELGFESAPRWIVRLELLFV